MSSCDTLIDLGCGPHSWLATSRAWKHSVGVEAHAPAFAAAHGEQTHSELINDSIFSVDFPPRSADVVAMMDVIEHLEKGDALDLLRRCESWAGRMVVIFTPNGFLPQEEYGGNPLQVHRSGWTVGDFTSLGYAVRGCNGFRRLRQDLGALRYRNGFGQVASDLSQIVCYRIPRFAYHLLAVKRLPTR